jgi:glycosyltransferase involved in cell wall biosynthesis
MAGSVAVLASRIYGIPEIVADGETGLLVPPAQVDPLAEALARLLGEPGLLERLGEAGYGRYKAGFTQEIMARRTYAVLEGGAAARRESRAATRTLSTREIRAMKPVRFEDGQGNA